jgi:replicative DNA helicase
MPNYQPEVSEAIAESEEALLGSILIESTRGTDEAIRKVSQIIEPWDFRGCVKTDKPERWVWRARIFYAMTLCELPPHQINVANKMFNLGILQNGDCALMSHLISVVPCSLDYMDYAKAVKNYSVKRQVKYLAERGDLKGLHKLTKSDFDEGIIL